MKTNREEFLHNLEAVQPGLASREIVEQSSCFVFKKGKVITYNDEISCRAKSGLDASFEGAVVASPLLAILRKMTDELIEVSCTAKEFRISGKSREKCGIRLEKDITLATGNVETPKEWKPLHEDFSDAISIVQECAGKDESLFALTCVHIHPKWVEAMDNYQMSRYKMMTGIEAATLVRRESLKHIVSLGMTEFSETETWIHFKNPSGLILSCRRYLEEFLDLTPLLKVNGTPAVLPKGLGAIAERAEVFSGENTDHDHISIDLRPGKLRVKGKGATGWYMKVKNLKYTGKAMSFLISPKLLVELVKRYDACEISEDRLKVDGGKFVYVTCLGKEESNERAS